MNGKWQIGMFGGLRLEESAPSGDGAVRASSPASAVTRFRTQKTASLLAYLAFYLQRDHPREELADRFWPDDDIESARGSLRVSLASLRRQLEPPPMPPGTVLASDGRASVRLRPDAVVVDASEFEAALARASAAQEKGDDRATLAAYRDALRWYRGPLLPGVYDDWVLTERDRLHERHVQALTRVSDLAEALGDSSEATEAARRLVAAEPTSEKTHLRLVRLLAQAGRTSDATHAYEEMSALLNRELNETPSREAEALFARLGLGVAPAASPRPAKTAPDVPALVAAPSPAPSPKEPVEPMSGDAPPSSLPLFLSRFFGREDELICLYGLLSDPRVRLTTVQGPGGGGKTRLAVEAVRAVQQHKDRMRAFAGGAWFVPLATVTDGTRLFETVRAAIGLPSQGDADPLTQIVAHLAGKRTLLLLDNMEQITTEAAPLVERLLNGLPDAVVLVTSRRRLGLGGERVVPIGPLQLPEPNEASADALAAVPSIGLFVDRAQTVSPGFGLTPRNAPTIAALCRRLEGLPLAIELAAAWTNVLSPQQLLGRMEQRFALLQARPSDRREPRHQSLWAAIADSYDLLPPDLKRVFVRLSAFRGGWTADAAAVICEDASIHDSLARLRERSLITATTDSDAYRFTLLETIREFAEEQLTDEEAQALTRRHADHFASWRLERGHEEIAGEQDNLRRTLATFEGASDGLEPALRLAGSLWQFWWEKGQWQEGADALARLLARTEGDKGDITEFGLKTLARAWNGRGAIAFFRGEYPVALDAFERSLAYEERIGVAKDIASLCNNVGAVNRIMGDFAGAQKQGERSLALRRTLGDTVAIGDSLTNLAGLALMVGDVDRAEAQFNEACDLFRGDPKADHGMALCIHGLAEVAMARGDVVQAEALVGDALARFRQAGQVMRIAHTLTALAYAYQAQGRLSEAVPVYRECLPLLRDMEDRQGGVTALEVVADWAFRGGDAKGAARLLGASDALSFGYHRMAHNVRDRAKQVADVQRRLDAKTWERLFRDGQALSLTDALNAAERLLPPP